MHRKTNILQTAWIAICKKTYIIKHKRYTGAGIAVKIKRCITGMLVLYHARVYTPFYMKKAFSTFSIVILLFYV